jgi:hypothetical protein
MGQLQKTPVGLARRILNFEDESASSPLFTSTVVETKPLTAEYPIQTICEAAESIIPILPTTETVAQPAPPTVRKSASKTVPEARQSKSTEQSTTAARVTNVKPKSSPVWKVGKASKNAVNSEVQSLSLANKVQSQSTTPRIQSQSSSHKTPVPCSTTKSLPAQAQSWAHACSRVQSAPNSQQQSRAKLNKTEPPKVVARHAVTRQHTQTPAAVATSTDVDEGWETVRGRTRSRTSPAKAIPVLTRASTMIYGSRLEARQSTKVANRQPTVRSGLVKPSIAQSLPSLCDRAAPKPEPPKDPVPLPTVPTEPAPVVAVTNSTAHDSSFDDSIIVSSDEDKDEAQEAAEVAEEEAEMARREEALTIEEENLQREIRETERSDNEGDETWDDPINVTPVCLVIQFMLVPGLLNFSHSFLRRPLRKGFPETLQTGCQWNAKFWRKSITFCWRTARGPNKWSC